MAYERQVTIKRTIYESKCPKCGDTSHVDDNPPRERLCKCGEWVKYEPVSYTGPELTKSGR